MEQSEERWEGRGGFEAITKWVTAAPQSCIADTSFKPPHLIFVGDGVL